MLLEKRDGRRRESSREDREVASILTNPRLCCSCARPQNSVYSQTTVGGHSIIIYCFTIVLRGCSYEFCNQVSSLNLPGWLVPGLLSFYWKMIRGCEGWWEGRKHPQFTLGEEGGPCENQAASRSAQGWVRVSGTTVVLCLEWFSVECRK